MLKPIQETRSLTFQHHSPVFPTPKGTERVMNVASMIAYVLEMDVHEQTRNRKTCGLDRDLPKQTPFVRSPCNLKPSFSAILNDVAA